MESQLKSLLRQKTKCSSRFKIVVVGDSGVGKSSIIRRNVVNMFCPEYRGTIGAEISRLELEDDENRTVTLLFWDVAGQEQYGCITQCYYRNADGAFIVYDVSRAQTFHSVLKWKSDLDNYTTKANEMPIPCVLLANKCDLEMHQYLETPHKMMKFCHANGINLYFETSAKEDWNIRESVKFLTAKMLERSRTMAEDSENTFKLDDDCTEKNKCEC